MVDGMCPRAPASFALQSLRPLFDGFPGLHGVISAALEGTTGSVEVDNVIHPRVARIALADFHLVAGDPAAPAAAAALAAVPAGHHLVVAPPWEELVWDCGRLIHVYERFAFHEPPVWDQARLAAMRASVPQGLVLERITDQTVEAFARLDESFVNNFKTAEDFLSRGVGFGIRKAETGEFVAGCSSFVISSRSVEFEIETREDYQRRGLALATGAALIEYCLDYGLEPCWDAAHEGSARLAERLGFVSCGPYYAYRME
jgi:RimJ/RimL family protein N-acetyltransferase